MRAAPHGRRHRIRARDSGDVTSCASAPHPGDRAAHRPWRVPLVLALAALVRSPLLAQQAGGARPIARDTTHAHATHADTTRARAARADSVRARRLAPVVVSGTRLTSAADVRTPARVDVVLPRSAPPGPAGIAGALERLPGVSAFNDQGTRAQPTLDVRGFALSGVVGVPQGVSVFLDGVRINEPDAQEVNFDLIPAGALERVELVRGPNAVFGKNTLAGALVLTTARGGATPRLEVGADAGAFGYRGASLAASGTRGGFDGALFADAATENGYQTQSGATTRRALATVGRRGRAGDVALSALYAHNTVYEAGSLPASWYRVDRRANYTGGDAFRPDLVHVALRGTRAFAGAALRGHVYARRNAVEQYNVNAADPNTRAFVTNRALGGTAELTAAARVAGRPLGLTVGAEGARTRVRYHVFAEPNAAAPDPPGDCDAAGGRGAALCESALVAGTDAALYAQALLDATPRLSVLASARGDYVRVPFRDLRAPANDGVHVFRRVTPKLGATYRVAVPPASPGARGGHEVRLYASVGGGFRAPAALELACADADAPSPLPFSLGADPPLRPVVAWSGEGGADWRLPSGATVGLAAFRTTARDEIVFVSSATAAGYFQNLARTRRDGVETTLAAPLPRGLRAFGSYTLLDATYRSAARLASVLDGNAVAPGARLPLAPRTRATAGVGLTRTTGAGRLDAALSARALSSQFLRGDEANREVPLPGYAVADLRLAVERPHVTVTAVVTNLLDRRYASYGVYAQNARGRYGAAAATAAPAPPAVERFYTPAPTRALTVGVAFRR